MKRISITILIVLFALVGDLLAQEINFGKYATDGIVLTNVSSNNSLDFGQVIAGEGQVQIKLTDPDVVVISIEAEYDKDVFVTINAPNDLIYNGSNKMPFTLRAAYANKGQNRTSQARFINGATARFPVLARQNRPPGPPPTPEHGKYDTPTATAYLYIYGDITVLNGLAAGMYTGMIDITVSYEDQN